MEKIYRAVFQAADPVVKGTHPILLISIGQEYHEGAKLKAAIDLLNRSGFEQCTIMVACSLQRHNFLAEMSEEEAYKFAMNAADNWIARNQSLLNQLTIPYRIIRWDCHIDKNEIYQTYKENMLQAYDNDPEVKHAVDSTIENYLNRQTQTLSMEKQNKIRKACFDYVIEECPVLMPLWAEQGYDYIIYPKKMTPAMRITYEKFVRPHTPHKTNWLSLRFRRKALVPDPPINA